MGKVVLAGIAVFFIGLSKAGFGGGLGMLTTPLCVIAFGAESAIGILLPLLCAGDAFSLYHYWHKWEVRNLWLLLPGIVMGVLVGVWLFAKFSPRQLNQIIGVLAVSFVLFQLVKERLFKVQTRFVPNRANATGAGVAAGVTSTFAHGAGPVITLFLLPQQLPKEIYVGTNVLIFTWINWIKFPFFVGKGLITIASLKTSLCYLALVPIGVWFGVRMNRKITEKYFRPIIFVFTFLAGLELIFGWRW